MLFLPDIRDGHGNVVYVASSPLDHVRIHCVIDQDGVAHPGLFVGGTFFPLVPSELI